MPVRGVEPEKVLVTVTGWPLSEVGVLSVVSLGVDATASSRARNVRGSARARMVALKRARAFENMVMGRTANFRSNGGLPGQRPAGAAVTE